MKFWNLKPQKPWPKKNNEPVRVENENGFMFLGLRLFLNIGLKIRFCPSYGPN